VFDRIMIAGVRRGSERALGKIMDKYAAYVCVVIGNVGGLAREDVEEVASDVFFALWEKADGVENLKPWLGAVARNKAKNRLRGVQMDLPLDEEIAASGCETEDKFILDCENETIREAVLAMGSPDSDIFLRHYYEGQTVAVIAAGTGLSESAVKHRLVRGRKKLREVLS